VCGGPGRCSTPEIVAPCSEAAGEDAVEAPAVEAPVKAVTAEVVVEAAAEVFLDVIDAAVWVDAELVVLL
jgi:hypothetical protein